MKDQSHLLGAVHTAARKLASTGDFDHVLLEVLQICVEAAGANGGTIYLHDSQNSSLQFRHVLPLEAAEVLQLKDIPDNFGVAGQVYQTKKSAITNFEPDSVAQDRIVKLGIKTKVESMITVPLMMEGMEPIGVVQLVKKKADQFDAEDAMVLDTVSAICTMAYLNSKLLEESTRVSQLSGMGKIGHDIKNLAFALAANVSFSDFTVDQLREELQSAGTPASIIQHVDEIDLMLTGLTDSISKITRYSTMMSDLSAGKALAPDWEAGHIGPTVERGASFLDSEARSRFVNLKYDIGDGPECLYDDMYIFRITQNLVSNAIKAVRETNHDASEEDPATWKSVTVCYRFENGNHLLEVVDQGPGMSPEIAERILTGNARSFWGQSSGSGWGTKIVLELASALDGAVSIESEIGTGSTFRIIFPHRAP